MQKDAYPVSEQFGEYLKKFGRDVELPILYSDLINYSYSDALKDKAGKWTHWENAVYAPHQLQTISVGLIKTYQLIKSRCAAVQQAAYHIERIDFCEYGNSVPFRIKIVDSTNGAVDYFYIKLADASRVYGLELEQLLTANPIHFICNNNTLVEEHIEGVAGDEFLQKNKPFTKIQEKNIASAFVRFSESSFIRLLGDMRCYNFVITTLSNNEPDQYIICAIDFDQQCHEGRINCYFPQLCKENEGYVEMVLKNLDNAEIAQIQRIELEATAGRMASFERRLMALSYSLVKDELSENYKVLLLRSELNDYFKTQQFSACNTMGAIVREQLKQSVRMHIKK